MTTDAELFDALKYRVDVDECGTRRCYNSANQLHCDEGPAIEFATGDKFWYLNGLLHRTDGPAVEYANGSKEWYINGKELTEAEFLAATQPVVEMTVADIENPLGKRVKIIK